MTKAYLVDYVTLGEYKIKEMFRTSNLDDIIPYICDQEKITREQYDAFPSFPMSCAKRGDLRTYIRGEMSVEQDQIPRYTHVMPTVEQISPCTEYNLMKTGLGIWYFVMFDELLQ